MSLLALVLAACGSGGAEGPTPTGVAVLAGGPNSPDPERSRTTAVTDTASPTPTPEPRLVSLDWLAGQVAVPGLSGAPAAPVPDAGLQEVVNAALAGFVGQASVVVHNLSDGRYAAVNESQTWYAASTFKAAVLLRAYQERDSGELDFNELVTLEEKYVQDDLGTLEYLELEKGDQLSVRDAVKGMIIVSDTALATLLTDKVGSNDIDETLDNVGATVMTVNDRGLPTTAIDLTQLMTAIFAGQGVTAESRDEMLSLLAQEWFTQGIIAGLPGGVQYAHKSGSLNDNVHDTAIVWGPAGPYVLTVMTDGSSGWEPIAAVSAAVYNYFAAN
jgi:beta-lactamase class A